MKPFEALASAGMLVPAMLIMAATALAQAPSTTGSAYPSKACVGVAYSDGPVSRLQKLPSSGIQLAGYCENLCGIVYNHCAQVSNSSRYCANQYTVCMNGC
jgi:hypothetical protein